MTSLLGDSWEQIRQGLTRLQAELLAELGECLKALEAVHDRSESPPPAAPDSLASLQEGWKKLSSAYLEHPTRALEKGAILSKTVEAFHRYGQGLDDLARRTPRELSLTGQELCAVLAGDSRQKPLLLSMSKRSRTLYARAALVREVQRSLQGFQKLASAYLIRLAYGAASLTRQWRNLSAHWCWHILDPKRPLQTVPSAWDRAKARLSLKRLESYCSQAPRDWARVLLSSHGNNFSKVSSRDESPLLEGEQWAELLNLSQAALAVEQRLGSAMNSSITAFQELDRSLEDELAALQSELQALQSWVGGGLAEAQPPRAAQITPSLNRLTSYREKQKTAFSKTPEPLNAVLEEAAQAEEAALQRFLTLVEGDHRRLLRALEQAREAVSHSHQDGDPEDEQILEQATENVVNLLNHWREYDPEWRRQVAPAGLKACAGFFLEAQNRCEAERWKRLQYAKNRFFWNAAEQSHGLRKMVLPVTRRVFDRGSRLTNNFLNEIGWSAAPVLAQHAIVRRPVVPEELALRDQESEIPAIYRRLFCIDPVSDPSFLIGRDQELAALDEAYRWWLERRPVSVLITGHRGSGKTSLLKCAFQNLPEDIELVRGEFSERVTTQQSLDRQICKILGLDADACLEDELDQRRRMIVLEEVERSYLRKIGGYDAARHLLRLIARSSRTTLWVLGMNRVAFDLLNAALSFGSAFSHRIDTAAVQSRVLRQAVMSRHNLSGLRLHLPQPEKSRWWRPTPDPETEYFKAFAVRTDGVFRTAFELWQAHVDKVQAGVLFMAPITSERFHQVVEDLDLNDLFTLVAILQHGSLVAEELAQIFSAPVEMCQAQLDELFSRELIGPDPSYPGMRIRPETAPIVRAVLYKKNLI